MIPPKKDFEPNLFQRNSGIDPELLKRGNHYLWQYSSFLHRLLDFVKNKSVEIHLVREDLASHGNQDSGNPSHKIDPKKSFETPSNQNWYVVRRESYLAPKAKDQAESQLFSEFAKVLQSRQNDKTGYRILEKDEKNRRILLESSERNLHLFIKPDTYQIGMQLLAMNRLRREPSKEFASLYGIFGATNRSFPANSDWEREPEPEWLILTDDSIEGVEQQRIFVRKALHTPDFAILDGPPGSGKTTTILELALQIAKMGKRVLLCSSTHVAIDNVLSRILEKDREKCEKLIMPVRISTYESQITKEVVKPNRLENLIRAKKTELQQALTQVSNPAPSQTAFMAYLQESSPNEVDSIERLTLESANLIAGTCTGVLQHPDIKTMKGEPEFDFLIVDEASKVTFQDFIMPALHAKRWVLIGDVHQLPPYVDDDSLQHFIEELIPDEEHKHLLICHHAVMEELSKARKFDETLVCFIDGPPEVRESLVDWLFKEGVLAIEVHGSKLKEQGLDLEINTADVVICENNQRVVDFVESNLKAKARLLGREATQGAWARYQQALHLTNKSKPQTWVFEMPHRSWGDLVVSKITQYYSYREISAATKSLLTDLEALIPPEQYGDIMNLKRIAFPSVLEILQRGADMSDRQRDPDVFSSGMSNFSKRDRFMSIHYQHRMHPDIATISKEHFYAEDGNLLPSSKMNSRPWHFRATTSRVEWYHNQGKTTGKRGQIVNHTEAEHMIGMLEQFLNASRNLNDTFEVALLTFYRDQENVLSELLQELFKQYESKNEFSAGNIKISLCTVDRFQGQEADLVLLGFTKVGKWAHYNSPNRLNVALTRARHKLILFGNQNWFKSKSSSDALKDLATRFPYILRF